MAKNIFISRPTNIAGKFEQRYITFEKYLRRLGNKPYRLGSDNFTMDAPLRGVIDLMKNCKGAIVLGYPQYEVTMQIKKGASQEHIKTITLPTPWNQIEGTLAFYRKIPVLVVAHKGISGGIFDTGVTGQFVLSIDLTSKDWHKSDEFQGVFTEWKKQLK